MAVKKPPAPAGAPEWMCTYGDLMSLLLCFFVLIVSFSEVRKDENYARAVESIRSAFGGDTTLDGSVFNLIDPKNSLIERLMAMDVSAWSRNEGDTQQQGVEGRQWRVNDIRRGLRVEIGGRVSFERFDAKLMPEGKRLVMGAAEIIRGLNTRVTVRGHATLEPIPPGLGFADATDLSYARAKNVADELIANGVDARRVRIEACGDAEPVVTQAYGESQIAQNRRVEIIVGEDIVADYVSPSAGSEGG